MWRIQLEPSRPERQVMTFGPFRWEGASGCLYRDGEEVALPPRSRAVLDHLLGHTDEVVSKQALLDAVWPDVHVADHSLKEAIHVLRQALGDDPQQPRYIQTLPRRGYRFIAEVDPGEALASRPRGRGRRGPSWVNLIGLGLGVALIASWMVSRHLTTKTSSTETGLRQPSQRFELSLPEAKLVPGLPNIALSADGRYLAVVAKNADGERHLHLRSLALLEAERIPDSLGAISPFFSPDARHLAFFTDRQLKSVSLAGEPPQVLAEVHHGLAGTWTEGGIVFCTFEPRDRSGLWWLPSGGGQPRVLTTRREGEMAHRWPSVLPDGRTVLYTIWHSTFEDATVAVLDLNSGESKVVLKGGSGAQFLPTSRSSGHLVYTDAGGLRAVPFDPLAMVLSGETLRAIEDAETNPLLGFGHFAVAGNGALVYLPTTSSETRFHLRVGDNGPRLPAPPLPIFDMRASPTGHRLALTLAGKSGFDVWLIESRHGALTRLTDDGGSMAPVWSADGRFLAMASREAGQPALVSLAADGSGRRQVLWRGEGMAIPSSWSADGRLITFSRLDSDQGWDLWMLDLTVEGDPTAIPVLASNSDETRAVFSPDDRFLAYESDETGRREIHLLRLDDGSRRSISIDGGSHPLWRGDGELSFRRGEDLFIVRFDPLQPERLEPAQSIARSPDIPGYNLAWLDGDPWILEATAPSSPSELTFIVHWDSELLSRVDHASDARSDS